MSNNTVNVNLKNNMMEYQDSVCVNLGDRQNYLKVKQEGSELNEGGTSENFNNTYSDSDNATNGFLGDKTNIFDINSRKEQGPEEGINNSNLNINNINNINGDIKLEPKQKKIYEFEDVFNQKEERITVELDDLDPDDAVSTDVAYEDLGVGLSEDRGIENEAPAFTYEELRDICTGVYNVGELKLTSAGKLAKINNHVGFFSYLNDVILTPAENRDVRRKVCKCLMDFIESVGAKSGANKIREMKDTVAKLLLNDRDQFSALSRDEVRFLNNMIGRTFSSKSKKYKDYTVANYLKLHDFKVGKMTNSGPVKKFVSGLNVVDKKALAIAGAVSGNAQMGFVPVALYEIRKIFTNMLDKDQLEVPVLDFCKLLRKKKGLKIPEAIDKDMLISKKDLSELLKATHQRYENQLMRTGVRKNETDRKNVADQRKKELHMIFLDELSKWNGGIKAEKTSNSNNLNNNIINLESKDNDNNIINLESKDDNSFDINTNSNIGTGSDNKVGRIMNKAVRTTEEKRYLMARMCVDVALVFEEGPKTEYATNLRQFLREFCTDRLVNKYGAEWKNSAELKEVFSKYQKDILKEFDQNKPKSLKEINDARKKMNVRVFLPISMGNPKGVDQMADYVLAQKMPWLYTDNPEDKENVLRCLRNECSAVMGKNAASNLIDIEVFRTDPDFLRNYVTGCKQYLKNQLKKCKSIDEMELELGENYCRWSEMLYSKNEICFLFDGKEGLSKWREHLGLSDTDTEGAFS